MLKARSAALIAAVGLLGALAPLSANAAGDCSSSIVIFSAPVSVNSNVLTCLADPAQEFVDGRIINPGSTGVQVRYIQDLGVGTPTITMTLDGLGFHNQEITLTRTDASVGFVYDSEDLTLADGPASSGCITATLPDPEDPEFPIDANSFHTIDSAC
jgi:hypothetical protein